MNKFSLIITSKKQIFFSYYREILIVFISSLIISIVMLDINWSNTFVQSYAKGEVAQSTIIAPYDFSFDPKGLPLISLKKGQVVVRSGDLITFEQEAVLKELNKQNNVPTIIKHHFISFVITAIVLFACGLFSLEFWPNFKPKLKDVMTFSLIIIGNFVLIKLSSIFSQALDYTFADLDESNFIILTPFATAAVLTQVIFGPAYVFLLVLSSSLLLSYYHNNFWLETTLFAIGSLVGALGVKRCSRRSAYIYSGIKIAGINLIIISFYLAMSSLTISHGAYLLLFGIAGGFVSGILAGSLTPFAEYFGGYITDIKLLELASLDRPLLRELSLQAPGTWNHSMVVGQIAEAAAEAINANGLLARVGAFYHDIGKIKKPGYFVENQIEKENRHDKLTPSMSALIIKAHVKDGIEMAEQNKLPSALIDFIPQHHGTALIDFFYNKALADVIEGEEVNEQHYRYGGPKPQTKEAGILMLADSVEAASRTLAEPSHAKIQGLVQKIINKIFTSGELDECDITLKDLHLIAKNFTRVLTGIYHKRVEYAESAEKTKDSKANKNKTEESKEEELKIQKEVYNSEPNRSNSEQENNSEAQEGLLNQQNQGTSKEALKRLGMQ